VTLDCCYAIVCPAVEE